MILHPRPISLVILFLLACGLIPGINQAMSLAGDKHGRSAIYYGQPSPGYAPVYAAPQPTVYAAPQPTVYAAPQPTVYQPQMVFSAPAAVQSGPIAAAPAAVQATTIAAAPAGDSSMLSPTQQDSLVKELADFYNKGPSSSSDDSDDSSSSRSSLQRLKNEAAKRYNRLVSTNTSVASDSDDEDTVSRSNTNLSANQQAQLSLIVDLALHRSNAGTAASAPSAYAPNGWNGYAGLSTGGYYTQVQQPQVIYMAPAAGYPAPTYAPRPQPIGYMAVPMKLKKVH